MKNTKYSFTMAEILISLTIIGVIAAITLPALIGNVNERAWDTQRRALHARMAQAIAMMPALNSFGEYDATWQEGSCSGTGYCNDSININKDTTAISFVTNGLAKVFELKNVCDHNHLSDCGLPESIKKTDNSTFLLPTKLSEFSEMFLKRYRSGQPAPNSNVLPNGVGMDSYAAGVETLNGESMLVLYNQRCLPQIDKSTVRQIISEYNNDSSWDHSMAIYKWMQQQSSFWNYFFVQSTMCVNFIYDLNGKKGPNKMYKDIGYITVFYPTDSEVVAPVFTKRVPRNPENSQSFNMPYNLAERACKQMDKNSRAANLSEGMAMTVNLNLYGTGEYGVGSWAGGEPPINEDYAWRSGEVHGWVFPQLKTETKKVSCVKR